MVHETLEAHAPNFLNETYAVNDCLEAIISLVPNGLDLAIFFCILLYSSAYFRIPYDEVATQDFAQIFGSIYAAAREEAKK